eukprot:869201-Pelagomonas_calceolata.AAC.1
MHSLVDIRSSCHSQPGRHLHKQAIDIHLVVTFCQGLHLLHHFVSCVGVGMEILQNQASSPGSFAQ